MKIAALLNKPSSTSKRANNALMVCTLLLLWSSVHLTIAEAETFTVTVEGKTLSIVGTPRDVMGDAYYSLNELAGHFGEQVSLSATKAELTILGFSASLDINGTRISTREGAFALTLPIVRQGNAVFIASADTPLLFAKAFHVQLRSSVPKTPVKSALQILEPTMEATTLDPPAIVDPNITPTIAAPPSEAKTVLAPPTFSTPVEIPTSSGIADNSLPSVRRDGKVDTVIIDPGHGGSDNGYTASNGVMEKDLTLAFGILLRQALKVSTPLKPLITRREDIRVSLIDRVRLAEEGKADLLVSLQCGGSLAPRAKGVNIYYPLGKDERNRLSKMAAEIVAAEIGAVLPEQKGSVHAAPLALFHHSPLPGMVIEIGYLSNADELNLLQTEAYQKKLTATLAQGLAKAAQTLTKEAL